MERVQVDERIKVRADFTPEGRIFPLLFKRGRQDPFHVKKVNATWEDREGQYTTLWFSVGVDASEDTFQLRYRARDRTWWLDSIMVEG